MEKIHVFLILILIIVVFTTGSTSTVIQAQSKYFVATVPYMPVPEYKTTLRFYMHDTQTGTNATVLHIAGPAEANNPTVFGGTFAVDDPLTEGPDKNSKVIGNGRGMYVSANREGAFTLVMYIDLGFTTGKFENSSLSVFSRNPVNESPREMAIVGGRGKFQMAKGYVSVKSISVNLTNGNAVLEYTAQVVHP